jgi:succinyl-CoA synthetase beta subunit
MILSDSTFLTLALAFAIVALMSGAVLYWINEPEKVKGMGRTAFKLILQNPKVKAILVNIFGGIVRCDMIAEGVVGAARDLGLHLPVVVRIEGTNAAQGRKILQESGLERIAAADLTDAAKKVVAAARK